MLAQYRPASTRFNSHHHGVNAQAKEKQKLQEESKILLSRLPPDVGDAEVEELFKKTVGPVKEAFIIYNSQGRSKGMAIVTFQRLGDAAVAKAKYDGKYIDMKRPIKIEIITDTAVEARSSAPPPTPSLLSRLGGIAAVEGFTNLRPSATKNPLPPTQPRTQSAIATRKAPPRQRMRMKKGPRRVKKTAMQLDKEIDDYRTALGP